MELEGDLTFQGTGDYLIRTRTNMKTRGEFCDVTIIKGDQSIQAHRLILAAGIPYFRALFGSNMMESTKKEISLEYAVVDPLALKHLIDFLYTNKLKITNENVTRLLDTSMYLQFELVMDTCLNFLFERMDVNNVFMIREYADLVKADMIDNIDLFVSENFEEVSVTDGFARLPYITLKHFISRDDLLVMSEASVFEAVMRWVKASEDRRLIHLPELLGLVRMTLLTPEFLDVRVSTEALVRQSRDCEHLVNEAKKYHSLSKEQSEAYVPTEQERYCKGKHHLKCAKLTGCSIFAFCHSVRSTKFMSYYDSVNRKWTTLLHDVTTTLQTPLHFICTTENVYFLRQSYLYTLNLNTLKFTESKLVDTYSPASGIVLHHNVIYLTGGCCVSSNQVRTFDPPRGTFAVVGHTIQERTYPSATSLGQHIYVIGGWTGNSLTRSGERYDPETRISTEISPMLSERNNPRSAAHNDKIYVCGGFARDQSPLNTAEVYDPQNDQWNVIRNLNRSTSCISLVSYDGKLRALLSATRRRHFPIETYDAEGDEWISEESVSDRSELCKIAVSVVTNSVARYLDVVLSDDDDSESSDEADE